MRRPFLCSYGCHGQEAHARIAAYFARRLTVRFPGSKEYDFACCKVQAAFSYVFRAQKSTISPFAHFHHTGNIQRTPEPDAKIKKRRLRSEDAVTIFEYFE